VTGAEARDDAYLRPEELEEIRRAFFDQARAALESLDEGILALEGTVPTRDRLALLRRAAHTLKGDCGSMGFPSLSTLAHAVEDALSALERPGRVVSGGDCDRLLAAVDGLRTGLAAGGAGAPVPDVTEAMAELSGVEDAGAPPPTPREPSAAGAPESPRWRPADVQDGETVRVEARRVDDVLNLVGEMVVARSIISGVAAEIEALLPEDQSRRLLEAQSLLARVLQDLQRSAMRMRMVPADRVFRRFARVVRDLGRRTGKRVALRIVGETTELDRGILDALEEPLLHLVRNAVDHGVEAPEGRRLAGKAEEAGLVLRAGREGNHVVIEVIDDGRGIDTSDVRARAVEKGVLTPREAETIGDADAAQLVFEPGLSTAREVTETSGRGVGLDVVRRTVESLKGSVRVTTVQGRGSTFVIRVPLTVAIIQALLFRAGGRDLAVPLASVVEIALASDLTVVRLDAREVFRLRNEVLDLVLAEGVLDLPHVGGPGFVVVVQDGARRFGLLVDELLGEQELVIKAVNDRWVRTPLVAGASVLGHGGLVLILDVPSVYRAALARQRVSHD
jgi:two-component system chemotaxis sensor kinase CheA